jgi:hypothetical protein
MMNKKTLDDIRRIAKLFNDGDTSNIRLNNNLSDTIFGLCDEVENLQQQLQLAIWWCDDCKKEFSFGTQKPHLLRDYKTNKPRYLCNKCRTKLVDEQTDQPLARVKSPC